MIELYIGCAGWEYKDWIGSFYPKRLQNHEHLGFYAQYFDVNEVNSTFYNRPSEETILHWKDSVPNDFIYIIKVNKEITHDMNNFESQELITSFFDRFRELENKIFGYLFQFPPWFKFSENHLQKLFSILSRVPTKKKLILEFRDDDWFQERVLSQIVKKSNVIIATSYLKNVNPYYFPDQEHYYIRLIGDRRLSKFNMVQREQHDALNHLDQQLQTLKKSPKMYKIFIIVNNHFSGFAPETSNILKKKYDLSYTNFSLQKKLIDFL